MRKVLKNTNLIAFSLVASIAAFGCTTNRTMGEGQPYTGGPGVGPASPTSNLRGTSVPTTPPPMTSSYQGVSLPSTTPRAPIHKLTADEAAMIMSGHQPRVRVLGPVDPGGARPYVSNGNTGQPSGVNYTQEASNVTPTMLRASTNVTPTATNSTGNVRLLTQNGKVVVTNVK